MSTSDSNSPGLLDLVRKAALTGLAALQNRGELFVVELQEEKNLAIESLIWALAACFMVMMFVVVLTITIIWLFREDLRIYAAGGFCVLYLAGAILTLLNLKALIKHSVPPFPHSIEEVKKDREWLESLK